MEPVWFIQQTISGHLLCTRLCAGSWGLAAGDIHRAEGPGSAAGTYLEVKMLEAVVHSAREGVARS